MRKFFYFSQNGLLVKLLVFLIFLLGLSVNAFTSNSDISINNNSSQSYYIGKAILVYDSKACHCVREKNEEIEKTLKHSITYNIQRRQLIQVVKIDYDANKKQAESVLATCTDKFLPVLILKSKENLLFYECSYEFDEHEFDQALDEMIKVTNSDNKREQ